MTSKDFVRKSLVVIPVIIGLVVVYNCKNTVEVSEYFDPNAIATHFNGEDFVGSRTCTECHMEIYNTHVETAHFNTSAMADSNNVKGSFVTGSNTLDLKDVAFEMSVEEDTLFQYTYIKNRSLAVPPSKFDIVVGSGVKGQSYLTWENDELYQLQVSYYTPTDEWVNSPSFPEYAHTRPIGDACLKCHMTFATNLNHPKKANLYNRERILYGIDCERCHGPSKKHVVYHRANPEDKEAKFTLKTRELNRQQRLDACAQCHSGLRAELLKGTPFSYLVGEKLNEFSRNLDTSVSNDKLDVHGNQYGLLTSSECFKQSETMDCSTCHDPHKNQRGASNYFNSKCIGCHSMDNVLCAAQEKEIAKMNNNCIECHMPTKASNAMMVQLNKDSLETSFYVRTHLIDIYSQEQTK